MTARPAYRTLFALALIAALVSACGGDEIDIEEAQAQFCTDVEAYVTALDTYGGLFEDVELTVGDVQSAGDELEPAREAVLDSAAQFQEAVEADLTRRRHRNRRSGVDRGRRGGGGGIHDAVAGIDQRTLVTEAGVSFTSAAYALQVAWVRLFADAGCLDDEGLANATQWVSDYVTALQTDLATAGYYTGEIDGIYGPGTIDGGAAPGRFRPPRDRIAGPGESGRPG